MKKLLNLMLLWISALGLAQISSPVKLEYQIKPTGDNQYEAVVKAKINSGYHIYSKDVDASKGPIPSQMTLAKDPNIILVGGVKEVGKKVSQYSAAFECQIIYFANQVDFVQKFKLKDPSKATQAKAEVTYQTCNETMCLAPTTLEFVKPIPIAAAKVASEEAPKTTIPEAVAPAKDSAKIPAKAETAPALTAEQGVKNLADAIKLPNLDLEHPLQNCGPADAKPKTDSSLWLYLFLGFTGGLLALLTPCVFPMIPMTVSYFIKSKKKQDAYWYAAFIFIIFCLFGLPFHIIDGVSGNIFNQIATNVWLNLFFFAIFLFFAFSFFGYYEIRLPNAWLNQSSKAEDAGGKLGLFFMALTLVLVSFSCTGPILGMLLGEAASGASHVPTLLSLALAGFGLSWALVFGGFALFPQALKSLPKSGGWLNTVKVVLGFIELALALKFLSKADLVSKTFLLKRELFVALWLVISIATALYLWGKIRFPHDSKGEKIGGMRKILAIVFGGIALYLLPGLFPSESPKLSALSGILPPNNVSYFQDEHQGILGLNIQHDFDKAMALAKQEHKVLMIDFTGYGCENCRKMEEFVWGEPDVLPLLQNKVVLLSLYVDDKELLPENQQFSIDMGGGQFKKIKTIGDKWSMFQQINFKNNSQPHYVLLNTKGQLINTPISGYNSKELFKAFLECGLSASK
jgi:thiol:disulfide interchange protein